MWDERGREYLDLVQGWAVNCLGHCPDAVRRALSEQAGTLWNASPAYHNARAHAFAETLVASCGLDQVFFCNSGAEANEGAIKLARKWGRLHRQGAAEIITTDHSFHGRTLATMAASGKPGFSELFPPAIPGFEKVAFGDPGAVAKAIRAETVAVMVEPIQGEAGVIVPPAGYLRELRAICDRAGILLILDEVQTGMRRTGPLFAHQADEIVPDIMTLGKGLGGGAPLSALLCCDAVACFEPGDQGGTFNGNPLMCAVGAAVLDELQRPETVAHAADASQLLWSGLSEMVSEGLAASVRGRGMLIALCLGQDRAPAIQERCLDLGLLVQASRPNVLRMMPALNIPLVDVALALQRLRAAMA